MMQIQRSAPSEGYHKPRSKICRNWERHGECRFGVDCWFEHRGHSNRRQQNRWSGEGLSREQWGQSQDTSQSYFRQGRGVDRVQHHHHPHHVPAPPPPPPPPQPAYEAYPQEGKGPPPPPPPHPQAVAFYVPPIESNTMPPAQAPRREWGHHHHHHHHHPVGVPHNAHNPYEQQAMYPPPILSIVQYPQYAAPPPPPPPQIHDEYSMPHGDEDEMWSQRAYPHLCFDGESVVTRDTIPEGLFRSDGEVTDDYETLLELDKHKVKVGVSEEQLDLESEKIPQGDACLHNELCVICHEKYDDTPLEPALRLPCSHHYHSHCIKTWLATNTRCPVCNWDAWAGGKTIVCATPSEGYEEYLEYEDEDDTW